MEMTCLPALLHILIILPQTQHLLNKKKRKQKRQKKKQKDHFTITLL